jgi:hypothetical protein
LWDNFANLAHLAAESPARTPRHIKTQISGKLLAMLLAQAAAEEIKRHDAIPFAGFVSDPA